METLLAWDKAVFLWLNSLGSPPFDGFWLMLTHKATNILLYLLLWIFFLYKNHWKTGISLLFFTGFLILFTDQFTNLFKVSFGRLRPCNDPTLQTLLRLVKPRCGGGYSFFSGHASNSFALAVFFGALLKPYFRGLPYLLLLIAALIAYSRIYIGVHFPLDILCGTIAGCSIGFGFIKLWGLFKGRFLQ